MRGARIADRSFFTKPAEELAPLLLGKILCRKLSPDTVLRFRLVETEAYPADDSACHANQHKSGNGVVTQNLLGGTLYVHYKNTKAPGSSFDIVSGHENSGEGVLIRGGINCDDPAERYLSCPVRLGEALRIDYGELNRICLWDTTQEKIWLEDDGFPSESLRKPPQVRVGLKNLKNVRPEDKTRLLRFFLDVTKL